MRKKRGIFGTNMRQKSVSNVNPWKGLELTRRLQGQEAVILCA